MTIRQIVCSNEEPSIMRKGMTLVEMVVVMGIIGILAVGGFTYANNAKKRARVAEAKNQLRLYGMAVKQYHDVHKLDVITDSTSQFPRWPRDVDPGDDNGVGGDCRDAGVSATKKQTPMPGVLVQEGFWKNSQQCLKYDYENWRVMAGGEAVRVVAITWYGLDQDRGSAAGSPTALDDNIALMVQGSSEAYSSRNASQEIIAP